MENTTKILFKIAYRISWMFFLLLKGIDLSCVVAFSFVLRLFNIFKIAIPEIYDDLFVLFTVVIDIILIFVFAGKFFNSVTKPFKKFNFKMVNENLNTLKMG